MEWKVIIPFVVKTPQLYERETKAPTSTIHGVAYANMLYTYGWMLIFTVNAIKPYTAGIKHFWLSIAPEKYQNYIFIRFL